MPTLLSLRQAVYRDLKEPYGSPLPGLYAQGSNTAVQDPLAAVDQKINAGFNDMARRAIVNEQTGTLALTATQQTFPLSQFDTGGGTNAQGTLWAVKSVKVNGIFIRRASRTAAQMNVLTGFQTWGPQGVGAVSFSIPLLGTTQTPIPLVVVGNATPVPLSGDTATPGAWCPDNLQYIAALYAVWHICLEAAAENETLGALAPQWEAQYMMKINQLRDRLERYDPQMFALYFSEGGGK